jgi:hypothetical protein
VSARSIAVWLGVTVPARAKLSLLAGRTFVTVCRVSGTYVRGVKPGKCTVTLVVTVTKGKKTLVTNKKATLTVS